MRCLDRGGGNYKPLTKSEKRAFAISLRDERANARHAAKAIQAEMGDQIAAFIAAGKMKRLQTQPNSLSNQAVKAPFKPGRKGQR